MKPLLRLYRGYWYCGCLTQNPLYWACAPTPREAYELWDRSQRTPQWVSV